MRRKEEPGRARDTTDRGSWGVDLSSLVARATSFSRSSLYASAPAGIGIGTWWDGGSFGGGGWGGGNNGTDGGVPGGDAMDEEGDGGEAADAYVCSSGSGSDGPNPSSATDLRFPQPKKIMPLAPWVWFSAVWGLYAVLLRQSPLLTKALTSGVLALGGDMAAQFFEFRQQTVCGEKGPFLKDTRRLLAVAIDSILITGPALHTLYGILERLIPTAAGGFVPAASHLLIDTLVFDPIFVTSFFCVTGMLESRSLKQDVLPALRREFWPAVRGSWAVSLCFCPVQFITFRYLPLEFRVLSVNVCDIAWTSVLSYFSHKSALEKAVRTEANWNETTSRPSLLPAESLTLTLTHFQLYG
eukprot:g14301.t1